MTLPRDDFHRLIGLASPPPSGRLLTVYSVGQDSNDLIPRGPGKPRCKVIDSRTRLETLEARANRNARALDTQVPLARSGTR
jgi:hypothetical protein